MRTQAGENFDNDRGYLSAERQLWCAVIGRALQDALDQVGTVSGAPERLKLRDDARDWFTRNDDDFRTACEAAGYDPDEVRRRIIRMMAPIEAGE